MSREKTQRKVALQGFTRNENVLKQMLDDPDVPKDIVAPQYLKVQACWTKLEDAHDGYLNSIEGDIEDEDLNKLNEPGVRYSSVVKRYIEFVKGANATELVGA